ncbi:uncharacterized protein LOC113370700 [Ctenocephalides felis]|uniref:uncharacterized protein LOC113370700 n=1 Tax=Ctenocephalides felis TaxID=7515 RepID=UPI000E6E2187|nr:uncharacterized protein LOC113370700 [Ctenocephalides felis]
MEHLPEIVQKAIRNILDSNFGIHDYTINIMPASETGDNFMGSLKKIVVDGKVNNVDTNLNLVCKLMPSDANFRKNVNVYEPFKREVFMYNVLDDFKVFQTDKGIQNNRFESYALRYAASSKEFQEYLILEDLCINSFRMFDKNSKLDNVHMRLVLKALAEFHALSFAMRDQKPEEFNKYTHIKEMFTQTLGEKKYYDLCDIGLSNALKVIENYDDNLVPKLNRLRQNCYEIMNDCFYAKSSQKYRVLTHGDCWINNVMFKYKDQIPVEVCILDWQFSRYSSPVTDLSFFFYTSAEQELLFQHFDSLIEEYIKHLHNTIKLLGSDPNEIYPRKQFQKDLERYFKYGLISCCHVFKFVLSKPDEAPDMQKLALSNSRESLEEQFQFIHPSTKNDYARRIRNIVKHASDRNFI